MRIANLTAFQSLKIGLTGMGTWIIQRTEDNWEAHDVSYIALVNCSDDSYTPEQRNWNNAPNILGNIWPIRQSKTKVEQWLLTVNMMERRRNTEIKKM
jgi:hypothetical protein